MHSTNALTNKSSDGLNRLTQISFAPSADVPPVVGQLYKYTFDDIGNRKTVTRNRQQEDSTTNTLNQFTSRPVPGCVQALSAAKTNVTVTLWGDNRAYDVTTSSRAWGRLLPWGELAVTNTPT
jgi:hypothetical protein